MIYPPFWLKLKLKLQNWNIYMYSCYITYTIRLGFQSTVTKKVQKDVFKIFHWLFELKKTKKNQNVHPYKHTLAKNVHVKKYIVLCEKCSLPFGRVHRVKHSWVPQNKWKNRSQRETDVKEVSAERQRGPSAGTDETGLREPSVASPPCLPSLLLLTHQVWVLPLKTTSQHSTHARTHTHAHTPRCGTTDCPLFRLIPVFPSDSDVCGIYSPSTLSPSG